MESSARAALLGAAIFHLLLAAFHLGFWKLFGWRQELARVGVVNRGVMQILNLKLTYLFIAFAFLMVAFPADLVGTALGRALLAVVAIFWVLRAIEQAMFFGLRNALSAAFFAVCLLGAALPMLAIAWR